MRKAAGRAAPQKLRLGPEMNVCQLCGNVNKVAAHEWANLREAQRREFFFSDDVIWVLRIFPWFGLFLATVFDQHESIKWIGFVWGFLATLPWLAITWCWKILEIRKSLKRYPPDEFSALERGVKD